MDILYRIQVALFLVGLALISLFSQNWAFGVTGLWLWGACDLVAVFVETMVEDSVDY